MKIKYRVFILIFVFVILLSGTYSYLHYQEHRAMLIKGIENNLYVTTVMAQAILPEDYHDRIMDSNSVSKEDFDTIVDKYNNLCVALGLEYIWSLLEIDGELVFTSSTSPDKDVKNQQHAKFFEMHANPQAYAKALTTQSPQYKNIKDKWGRITVVLIPFIDSHGRVGLFGASMKLDKVEGLLYQNLQESIFLGLGFLLLGFILSSILASLLSGPFKKLASETTKIANGQWDKRIEEKGSYENSILARSFNKMSLALREKLEDLGQRQESLQTEIFERAKTEQELETSKEKISAIFQSISDAVIATDTNGKIVQMNRVAEALTGWKSKEAKNKNISQVINLINAYTRKKTDISIDGVLFTGEKVDVPKNTVLISKNKTEHQIVDSCAPIKDKEGKVAGAVLVFRDVTEEYLMQTEIQKIHKLKSLGILAGGIAHDFNNLLTALYGNISLAKEELDEDHPGISFLEAAESSMDRASSLTKQLLTFAKGGDPVKEEISIKHLLERVVSFDLSGSNIMPVFKVPEDLWVATVDKGQIGQVFSNLVINAKQAMPKGGNLYITLENVAVSTSDGIRLKPGEYIKVTVQDEGPGIDRKTIDRILDPYFSTKRTGRGLGLTTAHSIVNKHGGLMTFYSEPGEGTSFEIFLPAINAQQSATIKRPEDKPLMLDQNVRILVMDDDEMICNVISRMLAGSGYLVDFAPDGKKAIEKYKKAMDSDNPFKVVVMDLTIPGGMGGKEAIKELLVLDPEANVIVSSGYASDSVMANYSDYGFKGLVAKPYTKSKLLEAVNQIM